MVEDARSGKGLADDVDARNVAQAGVAFQRTTHPEAQWFPHASLGLFMHWGIHSVAGVQPSWAMIKDYPYGGELHPPTRYYALAERFQPQSYDPDRWLAAAARAGFTYAVFVTKHHDGYSLWPSRYCRIGTHTHMSGRDLVAPYVEACRRNGLKVGFYFSPTDWSYPGYPIGDVDFDYRKRGQYHPYEPAENLARFEAFYGYTRGQLEELLTRYGRIDLLWFDGIDWPGITDFHTAETLAWIRSLQPSIVLNNRWRRIGDYETPECQFPKARPAGWWEACTVTNGHWGYNPGKPLPPQSWFLGNLARCRAWGGNFLPNVSPAPDGTMPADFFTRCDELAAWMAHSRAALIGAEPAPAGVTSTHPLTARGGTLYVHFLPEDADTAEIAGVAGVGPARMLRTGEAVPCACRDGRMIVSLPGAVRTDGDDVVSLSLA